MLKLPNGYVTKASLKKTGSSRIVKTAACALFLVLVSACKYQLRPGFYSGNLSLCSIDGIPDRVLEPVQVRVVKVDGNWVIRIFQNGSNG